MTARSAGGIKSQVDLINEVEAKAPSVFMLSPIPTLWYLIICSKYYVHQRDITYIGSTISIS